MRLRDGVVGGEEETKRLVKDELAGRAETEPQKTLAALPLRRETTKTLKRTSQRPHICSVNTLNTPAPPSEESPSQCWLSSGNLLPCHEERYAVLDSKLRMPAPETDPNVRLFLSCVSDEFHNPDPEGRRRFASYRDELARSLRAARVDIVVQEELAQGFGDLLQTLDDEIARCNVIVHLVGDMAGANPTADEVRRLRERHPGLFGHEPTLRARLDEPLPIAYTQWEFYLACHHRGRRLVFFATPDAPRSPGHRQEPGQLRSQERHRQTLSAVGEHRDTFVSQDNLCRKVLVALIRHGVTPAGVPVPTTELDLQAAREAMPEIVQDVSRRIKNPDPRCVPAASSTSTDVLLHALQTVAQACGISPRDLVSLLDKHTAGKRAAAAEQRTPATLCDLALSQIAIGEYELAMQTAADAAELAEQSLQPAAFDAEQRRETALNSWLILADAARVARHLDQAIAAKEKGGRLIDRDREPLFWADYHEPLATMLLDYARYEDAERCIRAIIAIREEHLGEFHLKLAEALHVLGKLLYARANHLGVEVVAERILRILEGLPHQDRISHYSSALELLGLALTDEGRYDEAEPPLRQALAIDEKNLGTDRPRVAIDLNNLAHLLQATNRLAEAEALLRRALAIDEKSLGPDHPNVGADLKNLAHLLQATDRLGEAEMLIRRALAIAEKCFGADHSNVGSALNSLAILLQRTNRLTEAEPLLRCALAIGEKSSGPDHPNVANALGNLAQLLYATNRLDEAEPLARRALAIDERNFGADHPNVASRLNGLALLLRNANRLAEAEPLMRRSLAIYEKIFAPDHPDMAMSLWSLTTLLARTNRLEEAAPLMRRAIEIFLKFTITTSHEHPHLQRALRNYAGLLSEMGRSPEEVQDHLDAVARPFGIKLPGS